MKPLVRLWDMPYAIMLVVEYPSGVRYSNQVGGVVCALPTLEGVLVPIEIADEAVEQVMALPYMQGRQGIDTAIADAIDAVLARMTVRRTWLRVDRAQLDESWEAWVHVLVDSTPPDSASIDSDPDYGGTILGFGPSRGVLTWPNSD